MFILLFKKIRPVVFFLKKNSLYLFFESLSSKFLILIFFVFFYQHLGASAVAVYSLTVWHEATLTRLGTSTIAHLSSLVLGDALREYTHRVNDFGAIVAKPQLECLVCGRHPNTIAVDFQHLCNYRSNSVRQNKLGLKVPYFFFLVIIIFF